MYHAKSDTNIIILSIFYQLKHIPSKDLVAQWVHPLSSMDTHTSQQFGPGWS